MINKTILMGHKVAKAKAYARSLKNSLKESKKNLATKALDHTVIQLQPDQQPIGKVLFSYIINGFFLDHKSLIPNSHTNIWASVKMAETFVELGYEVDVIHWKNNNFLPKKPYSAIVDVRHNLDRLAPILNNDCIKIAHLDTSHILFHNAAESQRLLDLQNRRGISLQPHRFEMPNQLIENADYATTGGNDACIDTFKYAGKKIYKLPSPCAAMYEWAGNKNWQEVRSNFLWFSSSGFVHKGLDLVLEAFRDLPECNLIICAPMDKDMDFINSYKKDLYDSSNIKTIGWIDIEGEDFKKITENCAAIIHTSCSEGGAPSVKTCMHAGLIPIVSYETAVDVEDFGLTLENCSIDEIKNSVNYIKNLSAEELQIKSSNAWKYARKHHTRENFAIKYKEVISQILSQQ